MRTSEEMIGGRRCRVYADDTPEVLLVEPMDEREWNPGNHFADADRCTARAFLWAIQ